MSREPIQDIKAGSLEVRLARSPDEIEHCEAALAFVETKSTAELLQVQRCALCGS